RPALKNATCKLVLTRLEMAANDGGGGNGSCRDHAGGGQNREHNSARPMKVENTGYVFLQNLNGERAGRCAWQIGGNCDGPDSLPGKGAQVWREHRFCGRGDGDDDPPGACVSRFAGSE